MSFDNVYQAVTEENDPRWAFGTGFTASQPDVDTPQASGVDGAELAYYCLMLGDDALIMSHRLQEWLTDAPELEEEVAIANIALDLLGQARVLLARAGVADGTGRGEDDYAFGRDEPEFRNVALVELPRGDFALEMARLLVFATWRLALLSRLVDSRDPVLAAVAVKGVKEVTYHRDYAARWVVRLGDGTPYSRQRMRAGLTAVAPFVGELFAAHPIELRLAAAGVAVDPTVLREECDEVFSQVLAAAGLVALPIPVPAAASTGRDGRHHETFGALLARLQGVARKNPGASW